MRVLSYIDQHMSSTGFRFSVTHDAHSNNNTTTTTTTTTTKTTTSTKTAAAAKALFEAAKANHIGALFDLASTHAGNALIIDGYRDWNGKTALLVAVSSGHEEVRHAF